MGCDGLRAYFCAEAAAGAIPAMATAAITASGRMRIIMKSLF
jgi:hypothetical protein